MTENKMTEMKIIVISGFLGAGKTTFIQNLVKNTGKFFCIIENEYAGSDVDKTILEKENEEVKVWELMEGCICCTMKNSLPNKIMNIFSIYEPEYLIIEATGAGFLSRIIETIRTIENRRIRMLRPITVVDADTISGNPYKNDNLYMDQIKNGQIIVLSKCEFCSKEELDDIQNYIRSLNPDAEIAAEHYTKLQKSWWDSLLSRYYDGSIVRTDPEDNWEKLTLNDIKMNDIKDIFLFMQYAVNGVFGCIVRAKGFLKAGEEWVQCDISGNRYSIEGTGPQNKSNMIFIGTDLEKTVIWKQFIHRPVSRIRYGDFHKSDGKRKLL